MTKERSLFPDPDSDPPGKLPHKRGSATSRLAARLAKPFACRQLVRVYQFFVERGDDGATDDECQVATGIDGSSQRPRRDWLSQNGYLKETANERLTRKGRPAGVRVWTGKLLPTAAATNTDGAQQRGEAADHA